MELDGTLLVVKDMERSKGFYMGLMGQEIEHDFGANVAFKSRLSLQTLDSWMQFTGLPAGEFRFKNNDAEVYFTDNGLEELSERLRDADVTFVHDITEMPWAQRTLRFYDPDGHMIEVGESMDFVVKRFLMDGMSPKEITERTMMPPEFIEFVERSM